MSIHTKNLQYLATEIYKVKNGLSLSRNHERGFCFQENENYDLRSGTHLPNRIMHTAHFGSENLTNFVSKLGKLPPDKIKNASTLSVFKFRFKTRTTDTCLCRLCKTFVKDLGFISVQISNGIHNNHIQYMTISNQKWAVQTKKLS